MPKRLERKRSVCCLTELECEKLAGIVLLDHLRVLVVVIVMSPAWVVLRLRGIRELQLV